MRKVKLAGVQANCRLSPWFNSWKHLVISQVEAVEQKSNKAMFDNFDPERAMLLLRFCYLSLLTLILHSLSWQFLVGTCIFLLASLLEFPQISYYYRLKKKTFVIFCLSNTVYIKKYFMCQYLNMNAFKSNSWGGFLKSSVALNFSH